jgi:outer membrane protein assembly factor BamE (lipoprotein component of BamABCDE complex)
LCCNYRHDGRGWMSDSNYGPNQMMPLGATVVMQGYGRNRVNTLMNGARMSIGNDYSRNLSLEQFASRMIVKEDPKAVLATYEPAVQAAITSARIMRGMSKEQVLMALGYPIGNENPNLDARSWRYWLSSFEEFEVQWSGDVVAEVKGNRTVLNKVLVPDGAAESVAGAAAPAAPRPGAAATKGAPASDKLVMIFEGDSSRAYDVLGEVSVSLGGRSVYASGSADGDAREEIKAEAKKKFGDAVDAVISYRFSMNTAGGFWGQIGAGYGARNTTVNATGIAVRYKK